jgi:hypothetical protein
LFPLANNALAVHDAVKKEEFMRILVGELKKEEGGDQNFDQSPFVDLYNQNALVAQSRVLSAWTVRTEVDEGGGSKKGILERTPLVSYSLSGRTIWLSLTGVGLLMLYLADRCMNPNGSDSNSVAPRSDSRPPRSSRRSGSQSDARSGSRGTRGSHSESRGSRNTNRSSRRTIVSYSDDSDQALLQQLFPSGRPNEAYMSDDETSAASSQLLGERYSASRRSQVSPTTGGGDVELANRKAPRSRRKY